MNLPGSLVLVDWKPPSHEQRGTTCLVVSDPAVNSGEVLPLLGLVRYTEARPRALYPPGQVRAVLPALLALVDS